ncbi:SMI1/KNR4 family protein [Kitasatospora sp. NPDC088783]|uniref:SMI1/KNR4 family protein n=1 Tax=Kitasatospora sp. NPDC088783 TaxID=3364077 RepID=UPI003808D2F4
MMPTDDRSFPPALAAAMATPFDCDGGDRVDFEPFLPSCPPRRPPTGSGPGPATEDLHGDGFRIFGQDGTGGYAGLWLARPTPALAEQPVVFLGSEGETAVIARDLGDFLWLLADGLGLCEAADPHERRRAARPAPGLRSVAEKFAPGRNRSAAAVIELAVQECPDFEDTIAELCR